MINVSDCTITFLLVYLFKFTIQLTVLEGSVDGLRHQGRPKRQWMDDIEEWSGCSYIQLKELSQEREQWRRKTTEWSTGHLLSPTVIDNGQLMEWNGIQLCSCKCEINSVCECQ